MNIVELEQVLKGNRVFFASINVPLDGGKWRVNLRDGPGWIAGQPADTLTDAFDMAMKDFRREWADSRDAYRKKWAGPKSHDSSPIGDSLAELLG